MQFIHNLFFKKIDIFLIELFKKTKFGSIKLILPSGIKYLFEGDKIGVDAHIELQNYSLVTKLFKNGSVGFAESYIDKDFLTDNLTNLLIFAKMNENNFINIKKGKWLNNLIRKINHSFKHNSKNQSKKNISFHYDLGNKFYEHWLDRTMTYSSGFFEISEDDLFQAQINKYNKISKPLQLNENSFLLEIGCGWGGFSTYVAKNFGATVEAITISKEQYNYTAEKIFKEGLSEKVNVKLIDYRDIQKKYDNIVSIEMFEAVGKAFWPIFFNKIKDSLKSHGLASLQIITIDESRAKIYQNNPDFIQQYIFPGGMLPSVEEMRKVAFSSGLTIQEQIMFGHHYAKTLKHWMNSFEGSWEKIKQMGFDNTFKRMWKYYLGYCEGGFRSGNINVGQFLIKKV